MRIYIEENDPRLAKSNFRLFFYALDRENPFKQISDRIQLKYFIAIMSVYTYL